MMLSMPGDRCDECGVLSAFRSKPDVLKLTESCSVEDGHGRCNPCSKFATLQAQIQEVEKTLLNLRAAQGSLISDINFQHSPLIRDVPNEVVRLIFSFCRDPPPRRSEDSESQSQRLSMFPRRKKFQSQTFCMLRLGAVCKKWREIAWATPELWTSLRMPDIPEGSSPSFRLQVELAKEWLSRTANLSLDISLETQVSSRNPKFNPHVGKLIEAINLYSGRWQCLDICIPKMYLSLFHSLPSETAQNKPERLQYLRLQGFRLLQKSRMAFNADGDFMKPTKVILGLLYIRLLRINWENVTSLTCTFLFMDECLELIRLAPKMTDFAVSIVEGHDNLTAPSAPLIHSQLRRLMIAPKHAITVDFLFNKLALPSLESFSCEMNSTMAIQSNTLIELLERSHPPLRHLYLARISMDNQNFVDLMTHLPQLEELEILFEEKTTYFDYFLIKLGATFSNHSESSSDLPFLPRLRSLKCQYLGHQSLSFDIIPIAFGKGAVSSDNATGNENFRRPLQSLTIVVECQFQYGTIGGKIQYPRLRQATVDTLLGLIENEGKTIEISYSGVDLLRLYETLGSEEVDTESRIVFT
jgi:hypothetical protein